MIVYTKVLVVIYKGGLFDVTCSHKGGGGLFDVTCSHKGGGGGFLM